jgi:flagellar biosynthesis protein FliQ
MYAVLSISPHVSDLIISCQINSEIMCFIPKLYFVVIYFHYAVPQMLNILVQFPGTNKSQGLCFSTRSS